MSLVRASKDGLATPVVTEEGCEVPIVISPHAIVRRPIGEVVERTSRLTGIAWTRLCSRSNVAATVSAKRVFAHAARRLGYTGSEIARVLGITPQAVSKHLDTRPTSEQVDLVDSVVRELSGLSSVEEPDTTWGTTFTTYRGAQRNRSAMDRPGGVT